MNHPTWIFIKRLYGGGPDVIYKNTIAKVQSLTINNNKSQKY